MNVAAARMVTFPFSWCKVVSSTDSDWPFCVRGALSERLQSSFRGSKVYRFVFHSGSEFNFSQAYVGQSQEFGKRYYGYLPAEDRSKSSGEAFQSLQRDPGVRVRSAILNWRLSQQEVELQFLEFDSFWLNAILISQARLSNQYVRILVENLAILDSEKSNFRVMNRGQDIEVKKRMTSFADLLKRSRRRKAESERHSETRETNATQE